MRLLSSDLKYWWASSVRLLRAINPAYCSFQFCDCRHCIMKGMNFGSRNFTVNSGQILLRVSWAKYDISWWDNISSLRSSCQSLISILFTSDNSWTNNGMEVDRNYSLLRTLEGRVVHNVWITDNAELLTSLPRLVALMTSFIRDIISSTYGLTNLGWVSFSSFRDSIALRPVSYSC